MENSQEFPDAQLLSLESATASSFMSILLTRACVSANIYAGAFSAHKQQQSRPCVPCKNSQKLGKQVSCKFQMYKAVSTGMDPAKLREQMQLTVSEGQRAFTLGVFLLNVEQMKGLPAWQMRNSSVFSNGDGKFHSGPNCLTAQEFFRN